MKRLNAVLLSCLLTASFGFAGEPSPADKKWLAAVEKMVSQGEKKVSTPKETRVTLLQDWAEKNGYLVKVTKTDKGFSLDLAAKNAGKKVAQR